MHLPQTLRALSWKRKSFFVKIRLRLFIFALAMWVIMNCYSYWFTRPGEKNMITYSLHNLVHYINKAAKLNTAQLWQKKILFKNSDWFIPHYFKFSQRCGWVQIQLHKPQKLGQLHSPQSRYLLPNECSIMWQKTPTFNISVTIIQHIFQSC